MINDVSISYLIFLMPLLVFVINGLYLGRKSDKAAAALAVVGNGIAMCAALIVAAGSPCHERKR
jgi:NADH-quinone oxidoreductase subunit L